MSQTLEQFQAYQTRLEQYDQAIALLYWDLQTAAPTFATILVEIDSRAG